MAVFVGAALAAGQWVPELLRTSNKLLPSLSPLLTLGGVLATHYVVPSVLLCLPLLLLPWFKGRLFCWRICPMGFVTEWAGRLNPRGATHFRKVPHIGLWLMPFIMGGALIGWPVFIWLDPLSIFNGFFAAWKLPFTFASLATAVGFIALALLSIGLPSVWCHRLCPLGAMQEWISLAAARYKKTHTEPAHMPRVDRRVFLGAVAGGIAAGTAGKILAGAPRTLPVRPPGAVPERDFVALCARCGNCMQACPYDLIQPDFGRSGLDGLFTPRLSFHEKYCYQGCTQCTEVCPTGALRELHVEEKKRLAIGKARIDKKACIAWENREYCVVCQEYCPYQAIREIDQNGVNCPEVIEDLCRGCGACESQCPARPVLAIVVEGTPQIRIAADAP
jgi:ferredoxin-type protein NapF